MKRAFAIIVFFIFSAVWGLDIDLEKAKELAIINDIDLEVHQDELKALQAQGHQAIRSFFPEVGLSYSESDSVYFREDDTRSKTMSVEVQQLVFDSGRTAHQLRLNQLSRKVKQMEKKELLHNRIRAVYQAYYNLVLRRERIRIQEYSLSQARYQYELAKAEYKLGQKTKIEYLEVESSMYRIELGLIEEKKGFKVEREQFKDSLGLPIRSDVNFIYSDLGEINVLELNRTEEELYSIALENRKEFIETENSFYDAAKSYKLAKYYYMPNIYLTGSYAHSGDEYPPRTKEWSVGVSVSANLFGNSASHSSSVGQEEDFTANTSSASHSVSILDSMDYTSNYHSSVAALKRAKYQKQKTFSGYYLTVLQLFNDSKSLYNSYMLAIQQVNIVYERLLLEREKSRLGELSLVDLMESEIEYMNQALNAVDLKVQYILSIIDLETAVGVQAGTFGLFVEKKSGEAK